MINDPSLTPPDPDESSINSGDDAVVVGDGGPRSAGTDGGEVETAAGVAVANLPGQLPPYDGPRIEISDEMRTSYLGYAMSTIVSRALPDVRDGFKPVQRRILYAMRELGLSPNSRHLKSAKVVGECFVAGTLVSTPTGLIPIEDLNVGDAVYTQSGVRPVTQTYVMPPQPLLEVELGSGRSTVCTPGQMFKVLTENLSYEWKRADVLAEGDSIVERGHLPLPSETPYVSVDGIAFDEDMAYLLGFFLADGWIDRDRKRGYNRLSFAVSERPIIEKIQAILAQKFNAACAITERGDMFYLRVHDTALNRQLIAAFDLHDKYADNIAVPDAIFRSRPDVVFAFVSGFADGDGSVHKDRNVLVLNTIHRAFLRDVQTLLHQQNIHSRLLAYDKTGGRAEWALEISSHSLLRLAQHLTLSHPVKASRLQAIAQKTTSDMQPEKAQRIPHLGALLLNEFREKHLGGGWYEGANGCKVRSGLTYENGSKLRYSADLAETFVVSFPLLETLGIRKKMEAIGSRHLSQVNEWQAQGVTFGTVRRVRPVEAQITYDIQVDIDHEFIANSMVVHNCMGNYHPHGDQALYGTMVRMAQPFSLRYPLVDGQGNFGSVDDDPPAAMRYCLISSSLIATASGLQQIGVMGDANSGEDISERVLSMNGYVNTASKWFDCGVFPTRRVVTRRGYEIIGTTNHPLLVCVPSETGDKRVQLVWKTIAQLQTGDYLVLDRSEALWPENQVDLRPLHSQLAATADLEGSTLPSYLDEAFAFVLGTLTAAKASPLNGTNSPDAFLTGLGLCEEASERVVPDVVLRSPQTVAASFLRGLFGSTDGSQCVTLTATSRSLLQQVQTLLLRFGIVATRTEAGYANHRLLIVGNENTSRFRAKVEGVVSKNKSEAANRYLFEPVVAIEDAGEQNVYSIRVDSECHSFVANGFVNHNTEARLTPLAMEMMEDIEKDTVNFIPTYDNERREPSILPGKFPNLLCNGGSGIAVGMATNMPPHNLREVIDGAMFLLDRPDATLEQLMQIIPGPDFPTYGLLLGSKGIKSAYATGRGIITMQAKTTIEPMDNGKNAIVVTELPYQVIKTRIIEQIADLVKEKKVEGITAVNDYSDKNGMRIVVELRRDVMPQKVLNYLLKHTPLRLNFGIIMLSLVDNGRGPKTLPLKGLLQEYLDHRRVIITRRTRFELGRAKARAHILEGLQVAVQFLDEVIQIIRRSSSTEQARSRLIERYTFSGIQAEAILNMQLRQLTGLEQDKIEGEYKDLLKEIARLEDILSDPRRVTAIIKADLKYLKDKFGDDRRTRLIPSEAEEINIEDLIAEEEMLITITRDGYVKRMKMDTFPSQHRGGRGRTAGRTKEEDNFEHFFKASTHDYILFFTDRGRVYRLKAFEVPETSRQAMGTAIINLIQVMSDEHITATLPIRDLRTAEGFLLMATERGEVKRTKISEYANLRANGLVTFNLNEGDKLSWIKHTMGDASVVITTVKGMAIQFNETDIRASGRASGGVRGITLQNAEDRVVSVDVVTDPASDLLVVSEKGLGKRTTMSAYRNQSRGGKGLKTMNLTDRTGCLVASCIVTRENQATLRLMIVTENGIVIRMDVSQVKTTDGRSTQGVKLIELGESDRVKTVEYIDEAKKEGEIISAE